MAFVLPEFLKIDDAVEGRMENNKRLRLRKINGLKNLIVDNDRLIVLNSAAPYSRVVDLKALKRIIDAPTNPFINVQQTLTYRNQP